MIKFDGAMRVLAIDPGKTNGFALWESDSGQITSWQEQITHVYFVNELNRLWPDIIVCESFVHTARDNTDYTPVEYISLVKWYIERTGKTLVEQTPAYGKGYFTSDKLKRLKLFKPAQPHAMDALRHLLHFFMQKNSFDLTKLK